MSRSDINVWRPGVLNEQQMRDLIEMEVIDGLKPEDIDDASSFDLHITEPAYELQGCIKPHKDRIIKTLHKDIIKTKKLKWNNDKVLLEKQHTYIFSLEESVNFVDTKISGQATGKSTFGRLDILSRLIADRQPCYDFVKSDFHGALWVEITPITFPVYVKRGMSLNQLRLFKGKPEEIKITEQQIQLWGDLVFDEDGKPLDIPKGNDPFSLSLNLKEDPNLEKGICAFGAKKHSISGRDLEPIDLTVTNESLYDPEIYWDCIKPTFNAPSVLAIETERFYILRSLERFKLPDTVAVYCHAVTENLGELRIHYAGFVHPGFGQARKKDDKGAPLIFEVRGHNIPTFLQHKEVLARLEFYPMSREADIKDEKGNYIQTDYSDQELKLSKIFREWK